MKNFFSHDMDAADDDKLCALMSEFGGVGYAVYFMLVEKLHKDQKKLPKSVSYIYRNIASKCKIEVAIVMKIIKMAIEECELFEYDETHFWSKRVLKNLEVMEKKSKSASDRGKLGAQIKQDKSNKLNSSYSLAVAEQELSYSQASAQLTQAKEKKRKQNNTNQDLFSKQDQTKIKNTDLNNIVPGEKKISPDDNLECSNFDLFWGGYHPAGKVSKKNTLVIWKKLKLDDHAEKILSHVAELQKTHNWVHGQYILHAERYLKQERWKEKVVHKKNTVAMLTKEQQRKDNFREALHKSYTEIFSEDEKNAEKIINPLD